MACGEADLGLALMDEAIEIAEQVNERFFLADYYRLKAELLMNSACPTTKVEAGLLESLCIAMRTEASSFELRSATKFRLWAGSGKRPEAFDLLTPVYSWFKEGFDTPDRKKAKASLDQLV